MFPPSPKRVYGTLAGSRFGGGYLADSGLVFPPVRPVPLRTARKQARRETTSCKPLPSQTVLDFDGSRAGWETRSPSVASTPHPRPAGGRTIRQCLLQPWRRCSVSYMQERRRSMPPPRVYRHRGKPLKNRVRPAMVRFLRTSSQDSPQARSSVGKIGLGEVAAYLTRRGTAAGGRPLRGPPRDTT